MTLTYQDVAQHAQRLSREDQAKLVSSLLVSLQLPVDPAVETAWLREVAEREALYLSGKAALVDAASVLSKARKQLK